MAQTIKDVMTANPTTLLSTATVEDAAKLMQSEDIGDVMVVNRNKKLTGILTDRDIVIRTIAAGGDPKSVTVDDIVSKEVRTVTPETSVEEAVKLMRSEAIRRLPVVVDGKPVGFVSLGDLAIEKDPTSALAEISAASPDHQIVGGGSSNGKKPGMTIGKTIPAVAFGASLAIAMSQVRGRSRRKTVDIAAKKLRRAGKKLRKTGDRVGAEAASKAADYVSKASKEIRKSSKKLGDQAHDKVEDKISTAKRKLAAAKIAADTA